MIVAYLLSVQDVLRAEERLQRPVSEGFCARMQDANSQIDKPETGHVPCMPVERDGGGMAQTFIEKLHPLPCKS